MDLIWRAESGHFVENDDLWYDDHKAESSKTSALGKISRGLFSRRRSDADIQYFKSDLYDHQNLFLNIEEAEK